jgi:uncharacterized protein (DUF362 family)
MLTEVKFSSWKESVSELLEKTGFAEMVNRSSAQSVLLKPNLVSTDPPPITTHVELVSEIVDFIKDNCSDKTVIIGEGCGMIDYDTPKVFECLGYSELAADKNIELIDLNYAPLRKLTDSSCSHWKEMYLPEIVIDSFLVSIPVLKAHSLSTVTLTMKNMIGVAPPEHYCAGSWKKSAFHSNVEKAIFELNRYRRPDFSIIDAVEGMAEAHLWGPKCSPSPGLLIASENPVEIDKRGAEILGFDWTEIGHIAMAESFGL